jgi:hypothetical protein
MVITLTDKAAPTQTIKELLSLRAALPAIWVWGRPYRWLLLLGLALSLIHQAAQLYLGTIKVISGGM